MTTFNKQVTKSLLEAISNAVIAATKELTTLDQAIGDGDHGINMERGFRAVLAKADTIAALPPGRAFTEVGKTLVMTVGGASGPLYGKLFMTVGQALGESPQIAHARLVAGCDEAIKVIKALGKSDVGHKTMLDVLVPVLDTLRSASSRQAAGQLSARAKSAADATIPMLAARGRASFLGERSKGHMDPGARSSQLIIATICKWLETAPN
ncbi:MAG: dihydroxyacetone kinase subunit L [Burkholderiaceae bacterium]|nr:MAG: dihydroxyacetone kinase subunit L [Burkholderiaceae bacterium]